MPAPSDCRRRAWTRSRRQGRGLRLAGAISGERGFLASWLEAPIRCSSWRIRSWRKTSQGFPAASGDLGLSAEGRDPVVRGAADLRLASGRGWRQIPTPGISALAHLRASHASPVHCGGSCARCSATCLSVLGLSPLAQATSLRQRKLEVKCQPDGQRAIAQPSPKEGLPCGLRQRSYDAPDGGRRSGAEEHSR